MTIKPFTEQNKDLFNSGVFHPLQSYEWGEFREKTGIKIIRLGELDEKGQFLTGYQLTIHKIPHLPLTIGYLPKGNMPTKKLFEELYKIGKENNCIFIQLEPNISDEVDKSKFRNIIDGYNKPTDKIVKSAHPLFTKYTFMLDLTKSENELLKSMHPKTRYNIRVAQKHGVEILEDTSNEGFETYWQLMSETTKRQNFYAHTREYHKKMWDTLKTPVPGSDRNKNRLQARLFLAKFRPSDSSTQDLTLAAWMLFTFQNTLYYPYGASSNEYRNVMASNLMMWRAIQFGIEKKDLKGENLQKFDMWGSLGENADPKDPWYGFHRLKQGYGPKLVEFVGSYDLVINPSLYQLYKGANKLRWLYLKLKN